MKSRFAFFVFVLLLLTVTVCAAQSPMGFSPDEFYRDFLELNTAFKGPKFDFQKGNEEEGARITSGDTLGIYMEYSDDQVTELYTYYNYLSDDDETAQAAFSMNYATLAILWNITEYGSDMSVYRLADADVYTDIAKVYFWLTISAEPLDCWDYRFQMDTWEEDGYDQGVLYITRAD